MRNKKVILSSILSLALCLCLLAGGTFALFTSTSEANIAINSGRVEVVATIENLALYSPTLINADEECTIADPTNAASGSNFANGGTAVIDDDGVLALDRVTPGDKVTFQIKVVNNSNVDIMYRTVIRVLEDDGLAEGLSMNIGGETYDGSTVYTNWEALSVAGTELTLDCSVELPTTAGNKYQDKSCKIVYTVEAVQGNTVTDDNAVYIGETGYATLEGALEAVQASETIEIVRPGTYAPFTLDKENVTVKGIVGEDKASSTVIKNTATERLTVTGQGLTGVTLDSLWIDSTVGYEGTDNFDWFRNAAIVVYHHAEEFWNVPLDLTVNNCHIVGDNQWQGVFNYGLVDNLTFTNNYVENFDTLFAYDASTKRVEGNRSYTFDGNTFNNLNNLTYFVWAEGTDDTDITFTNNTLLGDKTAFFYAINHDYINSITVNNNVGNITYVLQWFAPDDTELAINANGQTVKYLAKVSFDVPVADCANYSIEKADGTPFGQLEGKPELSNDATAALAPGDYYLVENATGFKYAFTVTEPVVGEQQFVELNTLAIENEEDLRNFAASVNGGNGKASTTKTWAGITVVLVNDIDLDNKAWTPIGQTGATRFQGIFDGQGHTIKNLYVDSTAETGANYSSGLFGWIEKVGAIKNVNVVNATVIGNHNVGTIVGYISEAELENCNVTNAKITCNHANGDACGDKAGAIAGMVGTDVFLSKCTATNCTVAGGRDAGQLFGASSSIPNYCTATDVTVSATGNCPREGNIQNALVGRPLYNTVATDATAEDINNTIATGSSNTTYVNGVNINESVTIANNKTATFENSTICLTGATSIAVSVKSGASLTINDGTYLSSGQQIIDAQSDASSVVINNGTYSGSTITWQGGTCETIINGGNFDLWALTVNDGASAPVTVNGGTFTLSHDLDAATGCPIVINGGNFTLEGGVLSKNMSVNDITIYGGTFNIDPSACVAEGYEAVQNADGLWVVSAK